MRPVPQKALNNGLLSACFPQPSSQLLEEVGGRGRAVNAGDRGHSESIVGGRSSWNCVPFPRDTIHSPGATGPASIAWSHSAQDLDLKLGAGVPHEHVHTYTHDIGKDHTHTHIYTPHPARHRFLQDAGIREGRELSSPACSQLSKCEQGPTTPGITLPSSHVTHLTGKITHVALPPLVKALFFGETSWFLGQTLT